MSSLKGQSRVAEVSLSLSVSILEGRCSQESHTETNTIAQYWGFVSKQNQEGILLFIHFHFLLLWVSGLQFKAFLPLRIITVFFKWLTDLVMENTEIHAHLDLKSKPTIFRCVIWGTALPLWAAIFFVCFFFFLMKLYYCYFSYVQYYISTSVTTAACFRITCKP